MRDKKIILTYVILKKLNTENLTGDFEEKVAQLTQRYVDALEKVVAKNPEQYFWMHKLWKY